MTPLLQGVAKLERKLWASHGRLDLFALCMKPAYNRWDLVASAPWLADDHESLRILTDGLKSAIGGTSLFVFLSIAILNSGDRFLTAMQKLPRLEKGCLEIGAGDYGGIEIERGLILTNRLGTAAGRPHLASAT